AAGFMAGLRPFSGRLPEKFSDVHLPSRWMWVPPLLLGIGGFILGCFPTLIGDSLITPMVAAVSGGEVRVSLAIWHGFNTVLWLSLATLGLGTIIYFMNTPKASVQSFVDRFNVISPQQIFRFT